MIRFEHGTTTVLLQRLERPPLERGAAIQNALPNGTCLPAYVAEVSECTDTFWQAVKTLRRRPGDPTMAGVSQNVPYAR